MNVATKIEDIDDEHSAHLVKDCLNTNEPSIKCNRDAVITFLKGQTDVYENLPGQSCEEMPTREFYAIVELFGALRKIKDALG